MLIQSQRQQNIHICSAKRQLFSIRTKLILKVTFLEQLSTIKIVQNVQKDRSLDINKYKSMPTFLSTFERI